MSGTLGQEENKEGAAADRAGAMSCNNNNIVLLPLRILDTRRVLTHFQIPQKERQTGCPKGRQWLGLDVQTCSGLDES